MKKLPIYEKLDAAAYQASRKNFAEESKGWMYLMDKIRNSDLGIVGPIAAILLSEMIGEDYPPF